MGFSGQILGRLPSSPSSRGSSPQGSDLVSLPHAHSSPSELSGKALLPARLSALGPSMAVFALCSCVYRLCGRSPERHRPTRGAARSQAGPGSPASPAPTAPTPRARPAPGPTSGLPAARRPAARAQPAKVPPARPPLRPATPPRRGPQTGNPTCCRYWLMVMCAMAAPAPPPPSFPGRGPAPAPRPRPLPRALVPEAVVPQREPRPARRAQAEDRRGLRCDCPPRSRDRPSAPQARPRPSAAAGSSRAPHGPEPRGLLAGSSRAPHGPRRLRSSSTGSSRARGPRRGVRSRAGPRG